jgi:hypothetical protein
LPLEQDTIVAGDEWALLAWTDDRGRSISEPQPALYQHVFGPSIPAYTIKTPSEPGAYRLVIYDRARHPCLAIAYQVVANVEASQPKLPPRRPDVTVHPVTTRAVAGADSSSSVELEMVNGSSTYLQAQVFRQHVNAAAQTHPGLRSIWLKASDGGIVLSFAPVSGGGGTSEPPRELLLPEDLPPGGRLKVTVPFDRLPPNWASRPLVIEPSFAGVGRNEVAPAKAGLKISIERTTTKIARDRPVSETRSR